MISTQKRYTGMRYKKRPEPRQVVPLSSLKVTSNKSDQNNNAKIVTYSGLIEDNQSWMPFTRVPVSIELSPMGWAGLHSRMISSMPIKVEVS